MAITRHATAHWEGDLKTGQGLLSTPASGLLASTPYGFNTRFGDHKGHTGIGGSGWITVGPLRLALSSAEWRRRCSKRSRSPI